MKCRFGHVTNSSSSSFILGFTSESDIESILKEPFNEERLKVVYEDCLKAKKMTKRDVLRNAHYYYEDHLSFYYDDYATFNQELDKIMNKIEEKMKENNVFVSVDYADEDGDADLEHYIVPKLKSCMAIFSYH